MAIKMMMKKTRDLLEDLVGESPSASLNLRASFRGGGDVDGEGEEEEELGYFARSPSGFCTNSMTTLSPIANLVLARCSRILGVSVEDLQHVFDAKASDAIKRRSDYARNLVEFCCFKTLELSTQVAGHLSDESFRRLTFDMMLAWETPSAATQPPPPQDKVDRERTIGVEAFSRIAPAVPFVASIISCYHLFNVLTASTGKLSFVTYDKYLSSLDRMVKKMKTRSESSHLTDLRFPRGERILEIEGTLTAQPVLEHAGTSSRPGRLMLTDHALYFEALKVVTYDRPKVYDLADDLNQCIKPELIGPWGTRLYDKAVMYKSMTLSEPITIQFPELTGHSRRDYWLAGTRELLHVHRFIRKFQIDGTEKEKTLLEAVMGILRVQALKELVPTLPINYESLLTFNLCDQLPGGDLVLEVLASMRISKRLENTNKSTSVSSICSTSALRVLSSLGVASQVTTDKRLLVGGLIVGEMTPLQRAVTESMDNFKKVKQAQATVDVVKLHGLAIHIALMKELLHPIIELANFLMSLASWDDPVKSTIFCCASVFIIYRGWIVYALVIVLLFLTMFTLITLFLNRERPIDQIMVVPPQSTNAMRHLLALQNTISQLEQLVKDGNIFLLKLRTLLLAVPNQVTNASIFILVLVALAVAILEGKWLLMMVFLEMFTKHSPARRFREGRTSRRFREWWISIPAAPVVIVARDHEEKRM